MSIICVEEVEVPNHPRQYQPHLEVRQVLTDASPWSQGEGTERQLPIFIVLLIAFQPPLGNE